MIKLFRNSLFFISMLFISITVHAEPPAGYNFLAYDEGIQLSARDNKILFVYFGRHGCGYCDKTNKLSFTNKKVKKAFSENYVLVYVDSEGMDRFTLPTGERITGMQLGERLNAVGTPVFFFMEPDGKEIKRVYGFQSAEKLLLLNRYIDGKHYVSTSFDEFRRKK